MSSTSIRPLPPEVVQVSESVLDAILRVARVTSFSFLDNGDGTCLVTATVRTDHLTETDEEEA